MNKLTKYIKGTLSRIDPEPHSEALSSPDGEALSSPKQRIAQGLIDLHRQGMSLMNRFSTCDTSERAGVLQRDIADWYKVLYDEIAVNVSTGRAYLVCSGNGHAQSSFAASLGVQSLRGPLARTLGELAKLLQEY